MSRELTPYIAVLVKTDPSGNIAITRHPFCSWQDDLADPTVENYRIEVAKALEITYDPNDASQALFIFTAYNNGPLIQLP